MPGTWKRIALIAAIGVSLALPAGANAEVLYDQTDHAAPASSDPGGPNFSPSNYFGPDNADRTADDFTVPAGETWTLTEVDVRGAFEGPEAEPEVNVFIYADDNGKPGEELWSQGIGGTTGPNYEIPLTDGPKLEAGTYWLTAQQVVRGLAYWSWQTRTVQSGSPAQWISGEGTPDCEESAAWVPRTSCWPSVNPDQVFALEGTRVGPPPVAVTPKVTLGKLVLNKKRGTAKQPAYVNVPGSVELSGKNVATRTATAAAAGNVKLKVKPRGKTLEKLQKQGHARTKIAVRFTPDSGPAYEVKRIITLRKRA